MSYCFDVMSKGLDKYSNMKEMTVGKAKIYRMLYYMIQRLHDISHENKDNLNQDNQLRKLADKLSGHI